MVNGQYVPVAAGAKVLITSLILNNPGISETVRRTRGLIDIQSDQSPALEDQSGAFGAVVVSDVALAQGVASIPSPITDLDDDGWLLWVPFFQKSAANVVSYPHGRYEFDSKAMRRVEEGYSVAFVAENANISHAVEFATVISVLTSLS